MISSHKNLIHLIIIVISALLGAFEHNQFMAVFPRCGGIRPYAKFPVNWAAVAMVMAVLPTMVKRRNLIVEAKRIEKKTTFPRRPGMKFKGIGQITRIKVEYVVNSPKYFMMNNSFSC